MTLLAFAGYSGLLAGVAVSAGSPPVRNIAVAYRLHVGPYRETGRLFTESCSVSPKLCSIAIYYDNPHVVPPLRTAAPCGDRHLPLHDHPVHLAGYLPCPSYIKERKLCAHPRLEIYQRDQIYSMCPLAWQGDFCVPEVKETNRKSWGPLEDSDVQVDCTGADTMSDTSSVSLEVGPDNLETSAATLSPGVSSRSWDDGDTCSKCSYSEWGGSRSSFEGLDLEGEGPLGEPQLSPEDEPLGGCQVVPETQYP
ncbi:hypothetical protein MC885_001217 [Smutsia gigantea]|nr:hypothetical protein MC885_001217 [Smutsia gigantea]